MLENFPKTNKKTLAHSFKIARRSLYQDTTRQNNKDAILKEQIESVLSSQPSYGYRRIALELSLGKKRVRRCMQLFDIKPYKRKARWRKRRDERKAPAPFANQIKNQCPIQPNITWVGDFTYPPFKGRFLYLATFLDLFTREVVGWQVSSRHDKNLVMQAFLDGLVNRDFKKPIYIHTDQGSEYTNQDYTKLVQDFGVTVSMSKKASPWENGFQESFYNNFKTDLGLEFDRFETEGHFLEEIHSTLYNYNHKRIHTTLKMPPAKFHANYLETGCKKRGA